MSYFNKLAQTIGDSFSKFASDINIRIEAAKRDQGGSNMLSGKMKTAAVMQSAQELQNWINAVMLATDPEQPSRVALAQFYQNMELDNHLMATINNRIEAVQASPFRMANESGEEDIEATKLLRKMWFLDFIKIALESQYKGTKVIEIYKLRENGQLSEITEIPMSHIIPQKKWITEEPGGDKGWSYEDGKLATYYLQIGKDGLLGLFNVLAPIVLAKKLGMGSWLDYIEKYGVPSIFMFTDREDTGRLQELKEMLMNFKSNQYVIGRGNERLESPNQNGGTQSTDVFDKLIERANSEISKRVNGATGTTDEKSYAGSSEVHSEILKTKIKLDRFFVANLVNEELIPRLAMISPEYSSLVNLEFQWDEAETLTLKELVDAIVKLSAYYEVDLEYVSEKTGIPVIAIKEQMQEQGVEMPEKKK